MMLTVAATVLKATLAAGITLLATFALRNSRAAVRHVVIAAAFAILLLLLIPAPLLPAFDVDIRQSLPGARVVGPPLPVPAQASEGAAALVAASTPTAREPIDPIQVAMWAWVAGAILFMLPLGTGLWEIRRIRRLALPWRAGEAIAASLGRDISLRRNIPILWHESMASPATCGVLRPAVIFPPDARTWSDADIRRALLHELEHVRRYDWLVHAIAGAICALYWFHPLVWMCWRRLNLEAERACDDAVLLHDDATSYAEQLVTLAERLVRQPHRAALAMGNRDDLAVRVRSVLAANGVRDRLRTPVVLVTIVLAITAGAGVSSVRVVFASAAAQTDKAVGAGAASFDVASVKPHKAGELAIRVDTEPGGHFIASNVPVRTLIRIAYGLEDFQVIGADTWVNEDRFDVLATAPRELAPMSGPFQGPPELRPMLRSLLAERFGLAGRMETRDLPALALTRPPHSRNLGAGLKPSSVDCAKLTAEHKPDDEPLHCGLQMSPGTLVLEGTSIGQLAAALTQLMGRKIIDRTGVGGNYDLQLSWTPVRPGNAGDGRTLATALQEEAGFTLERTRAPMPVLIIQSIHRPTAN